MTNRFINHFWLLAVEMYYQKKEGMFVIVLALVVLFSGLFFGVDDDNGISLTGAAVSNVGNVVAVPEEGDNLVEGGVGENVSLVDSYSNIFNDSSKQHSSNLKVEVVPVNDGSLLIQEQANGSQCGVVNGNINLVTSISVPNTTGTCFTINASNLVIDGKSLWINATGTVFSGGVRWGINNSAGFDNITIKNLGIYNFTVGIYMINASNVTIYNNTIVITGITPDGAGKGRGIDIFDQDDPIGCVGCVSGSSETKVNISYNRINSSERGIRLMRSNYSSISYNVINSSAYTSIYLDEDYFTNVYGNIVRTYTDSSSEAAIYIDYGGNRTFENNTMYSLGATTTFGLVLSVSDYNSFSYDKINTTGSNNGWGLLVTASGGANGGDGSDYNSFFETQIMTNGSGSYAIYIDPNSTRNVFMNLNLSVKLPDREYSLIRDLNNGDAVNVIAFNNSFGEIKWIDNGTINGFAHDMDLNGTAFGLGINVFIENNSAGVNISSFTVDFSINSSVNITFYNMPFTNITTISQSQTVNTSILPISIYATGSNCLNTTCFMLTRGVKWVFNTSTLGVFALNGTDSSTNIEPNITRVFVNASSFENRSSDDLQCWVNGSDFEVANLRAYWSWYNGATLHSFGFTDLYSNTLTKIATVAATHTDVLDRWNCSVRLFDGVTNETDLNNVTMQVSYYLCGDAIYHSVNLTQNIEMCSVTGLNITNSSASSPVVLDCGNNVSIRGEGSALAGVFINNSNFITVRNCNISDFQYGIYASSVLNGVFTNNSINGSSLDGMLFLAVNHSTVSLNKIKDFNRTGITFDLLSTASSVSNNNTIANNTIRNNRDAINGGVVSTGLVLETDYNLVVWNNFSHLRKFAVNSFYAKNNTFQNNFYWNTTVGVSIRQYNNFSAEKFYDLSSALSVYGPTTDISNPFVVKDSIFESNAIDLNITYAPTNISLYNSSLSKDKQVIPANARAYFYSYVDVNVSLTSGGAAGNVNVTAYNSLDTVEDIKRTDANGFARLIVTEYYKDNGINYFITPSTIKITQSNFSQNSTVVNLLNITQQMLNLTTSLLGCGSVVESNFEFGNNYVCGNLGVNVTASSIIIEGNNLNLTGNGSGIGIDVSHVNYTSIKRLQIQNFSQGVRISYSNYSNLTGVRIVNNSIGVYFDHSHGSNVFDSVIGNNTNISVFAVNDESTNNSLVNVSIYNLENISVEGTATVFRKWYVDVNVTFNGGNSLANANVSSYFNSTGILDSSGTTGADGHLKLAVTELKVNSSGVTYLTPNSINISFKVQGTPFTNSTVINLTQTNNTIVHLSLALNCTAPSTNLYLGTGLTTFCPGTYNVENITVSAHNVRLYCIDTIFKGSYPSSYRSGLIAYGKNNTRIEECEFSTYYYGIELRNPYNFTSVSNTFSNSDRGIDCIWGLNSLFNSSTFSTNTVDLYLEGCNLSTISHNLFSSTKYNVELSGSNHNIIKNNTFKDSLQGFRLDPGGLFTNGNSTNNTFYHNNFTSMTDYYVRVSSGGALNFFNITANSSINFSAQGNIYEDYCDKGTDINNDNYADAPTSSSSADWPYNDTVSTKIGLYGAESGAFNDYGPRMFDCPPTSVFLSSSGTTTSSSSKAGAGGGAAAAAPSAPSAAASTTSASSNGNGGSGSGSFYSAADVKKFLRTSEGAFESKKSEQGIDVFVTLENTGDKPMKILPMVAQETEDPYFMLTRKTLGSGDNSGLHTIAKLSYSKNPIAGTLLKAILVNQEEIVIPPGGKVEKALQVKEGFGATKPLKIQFSSLGETVLEKDVKVDTRATSAAVVDTHENYIDIYAILVPEGAEKSEGVIVGSELTGAVILDKIPVFAKSNSPYFLELSLNKKNKFGKLHTVFSDQYGPYPLKQKESFLFAQQLKYDSAVYSGDYVVQTKMYHGPALVVQNEFEVVLGSEGKEYEDGFWLWVVLLAVIAIIMGQGIYFMNVYYKN